MKNYIRAGNTMPFTASAAVSAGDVVQEGQMVGVSINDVANGAEGEMTREGVYDLPKNNAEAWTRGQLLWWDGTEVRTATAVGRVVIGFAARDEASANTTGHVLLDGTARADD